MSHDLLTKLKSRGLIAQVNDDEGLTELLQKGPCDEHGKRYGVYCGFDPTAKSLTIGHLAAILNLRRAQDAGLQPIILFGGATGLIGDPTGRTDMRPMNTPEQIAAYVENFSNLVKRYFRWDVENKPIFVNNIDWIGPLNWLAFNREIAVHFNVSRLIASEVNKARLEHGLTLMELSYQVMQAYDWYFLCKNYNCIMQIGGNDQWANILAGTDLIRKLLHRETYCFTAHLVVDKHGRKIGKTAGNAIWIDGDMTPPYDFFQYVRNVPDETVDMLYRIYTELPIAEIEKRIKKDINAAKEHLAIAITTLVHGELATEKALSAVHALFAGEGNLDGAPHVTISAIDIDNGIDAASLLTKVGICASKSDARRLIQGGGILFNEAKVSDAAFKVSRSDFAHSSGGMLVRRGKKDYFIVKLT